MDPHSAPGAKAKTSSSIGAKDLIVCNHTSFLEILYLSRRFSPLFVFVNEDGASKGLVHVCGILEAIYRSLALPVAYDRSTVRLLLDIHSTRCLYVNTDRSLNAWTAPQA